MLIPITYDSYQVKSAYVKDISMILQTDFMIDSTCGFKNWLKTTIWKQHPLVDQRGR